MPSVVNTTSMAEIAVVHPDLGGRGGAESVCMHVLETLQSGHDLTLFTLARPDVPALNRYFGTDVHPLRIRFAGRLGPALNRRGDHRFATLQAALLGRYVRERATGYDLVVSTKNEFAVDVPSIQYVHSPQFAAADPGIDRENSVQWAYDRLCRRIAGIDEHALRSATYLTNSEWTAGVLEDAHGVHAETVYPPVDASSFPERPWDEREDGFLTIGRIGPSKRVVRNIEVVDALRERGHDVHLHVVGPTTDGEYATRVEREAARRAFVSLEGALDRDDLIELVVGHKYGLHGRPYEHFGIAVAELVAGGAIPFAPDAGGQREILRADPRLLYGSAGEAVATIDAVLSDPDAQRALRATLRDAASAFGPERFADEIRTVVEPVLP
jgi:glycosyltransferase involved in cell wall biosynthesis